MDDSVTIVDLIFIGFLTLGFWLLDRLHNAKDQRRRANDMTTPQDTGEPSVASSGSHTVGPALVERFGATKVIDVGESGPALVSDERDAIVEVLECWRRSDAIQQQLPERCVVSLCGLLWRTR